ncbi:MAG TPA: peptide chain release factor N(5)-glutamine methyltransferase [Candidatus Cybelea sp.]|nr:peptide chain release factor N(5)-glutamine methyltransferase [Candidatus Cybelea sp.]
MISVAALLSEEIDALGRSSASPRADAALLLARALDRPRDWLIAHGDAEVSEENERRFRSLCERRRSGVPVAYLTGSAWFYGREFVVNDSVLVPRPETEHLIDEALRFVCGAMRVLDVGTGSGAIACTIVAETKARVDATDASPAAIATAVENARRLKVEDRCTFYLGDLVEPVRGNRYDIVIANLPYVPTDDLPRPPEPASFEPPVALDGGADGLELYERLLPSLPSLINEGGMILLECAPPTIRKLTHIARATFPSFVVEEGKDYAGLPRYVKVVNLRGAALRAGEAASEAARSHGGRERG